MKIILTLLLLVFMTLAQENKKTGNDEVDHLSLAALLVNDGFYQRADDTLKEVDTTQKNFNFSYYYTLRGVVANKLTHYADAISYFELALEYPQTEHSVYLYIAEAAYKLKDYARTIKALDDAGALADARPNLVAFRAEAYWKQGSHAEAIGTLDRASTRFGDDPMFSKQKFFYLVQLGLFQEAVETATQHMNTLQRSLKSVDAQTYLAFATSLQRAGEIDQAIKMLEEGRLKFISDPKLTVLLAHLYIGKNQIFSAASLFEHASYFDHAYTKESSEMYRRAKAFVHALYLNSQVLDQEEKLKQRLAIFIEFGEYDRAVAMQKDLERIGLLEKNEEIRYALAYTYYMNGDYDASEALLSTLTKPDLFTKGMTLRNNMEQCRVDRWECL